MFKIDLKRDTDNYSKRNPVTTILRARIYNTWKAKHFKGINVNTKLAVTQIKRSLQKG